jgi:23S rRNA (adenine2503-C2)-methyltransferase
VLVRPLAHARGNPKIPARTGPIGYTTAAMSEGSPAAPLWQLRRPRFGLPSTGKINLRGLTRSELAQWLTREIGAPRFRADQVFEWIHRHRASDFAAMTNLSKADRAKLDELATLERLEIDAIQRAADGTRKLRLRTREGNAIESVLIPNQRSKSGASEGDTDAGDVDERGLTQCISSQVGCAVDCRFCATASLGFVRNLASWEIVDQVERARDLLAREAVELGLQWPARITNIVYMGMGEPLHNFNAVEHSIDILTDERGEPIAGRRITVSTSGLVPAIERFAREGLGLEVGLAISLNATRDEVRDQVMPINRRWNIEQLLAAVREVPTSRRRHLTFEYVLLGDVNDGDDDARRLVALLREFHCHVNVIPFNPHPHAPFVRPTPARTAAFMAILRAAGLPCWLRTPRGDDIQAACGQLALDG